MSTTVAFQQSITMRRKNKQRLDPIELALGILTILAIIAVFLAFNCAINWDTYHPEVTDF